MLSFGELKNEELTLQKVLTPHLPVETGIFLIAYNTRNLAISQENSPDILYIYCYSYLSCFLERTYDLLHRLVISSSAHFKCPILGVIIGIWYIFR